VRENTSATKARAYARALRERCIDRQLRAKTIRVKNGELGAPMAYAIFAYQDGRPVVVLDQERNVLHGREFLEGDESLKVIAEFEAFKVLYILDVPRGAFESSDRLGALEKARLEFLSSIPRHHRGFS